jgi:plasmid stabilization system protein ParE
VIWSGQAIGDLRDLCSYIARHDPEAALRMSNGILDHVQILAHGNGQMPAGRLLNNIK